MTKILSNEYLKDFSERLELSVKEEQAKGKRIEEIHLCPGKYSLLVASSPPHMLELKMDQEENELLFMGIPLKRNYNIDKEFDWQIKFDEN
ncbi:hypothetical protein [Paenibacillus sp. FSL H7-0331]|uniref:hypothetical protein n=1 Tax=Paenibacillus sp. FSL H7-0331 TaxID=1920421 RepID=UPI00096F9D2E|nr:hypothetical protein [Paenibacillus sp. FSL H7-0331]OME93332.1 hypothetical protein BK127_41850 [Paenibacillus sp. FSL H7-0331]